jgi:hypothetical protein
VAFAVSYAALCLVQGLTVALPRPEPLRRRLPDRLRTRWWALLPVASIVAAVFGIRAAAGSATVATYAALVASPPLAWWALTLLAVPRRAAGLAVAALLGLAWLRAGLASEAASVALTALGCATLGALLAVVTPARWLAVGIVAMAATDAALVIGDLLQAPNGALVAAAPALGLPQLQRAELGDAVMGYGDVFLAAVLGGLVAVQGGRRVAVAAVTTLAASAFGLLFFAVDLLPATVPVAFALGVHGAMRRRAGERS